MGTGTPSQYPLPSARKPGEKPWIVSPPMNQYVTPLSVHNIPYVAMNGGSFNTVTINPFATPTSAPKPRPVAMPSAIEPVDFMTVAARHAERPTLAPTDR